MADGRTTRAAADVPAASREPRSPSRPDPFTLVAVRRGRDRGARRGGRRARSGSRPTSTIASRSTRSCSRRSTGTCPTSSTAGRARGSPAAHFEDTAPPAPASSRPGPRRPRGRLLLRAKDRLSDDFADAPADARAAARRAGRVGRLRGRAGRPARARRSGASGGSTTSGSSTASPTSADAAFERLLGRPSDLTWAGIARDLQGDRRRRPRPVEGPGRHPPPEVAAPALEPAQARSWAEMVSSRSISGGAASRPVHGRGHARS